MRRTILRAFIAGLSMWLVVASGVTVSTLGLSTLALSTAAEAADVRIPHASAPGPGLPFARGERAQSVWASNACFRDCGAYCAAGQAACLYSDSQGQCLKRTDDCDRYCQRSCRTAGGPWLPIDF